MRYLNSVLLSLIVLPCFTAARADIIRSNTCVVPVCITITKSLECKDLAIVKAERCPSGIIALTLVKDTCLGTGYWACQNKFFWMTQSFFDSTGIDGKVLKDAANAAFQQLAKSKASVQPGSVHLITDTIASGRLTVSTSDSLQRRDLIYTAFKVDTSVILRLTERTSYYSNNNGITEMFDEPLTNVISKKTKPILNKVATIKMSGTKFIIAVNKSGTYDITVTNSLGKKIVSEQVTLTANSSKQIFVEKYSSGSYVLNVKTGKNTFSQAFSITSGRKLSTHK